MHFRILPALVSRKSETNQACSTGIADTVATILELELCEEDVEVGAEEGTEGEEVAGTEEVGRNVVEGAEQSECNRQSSRKLEKETQFRVEEIT